MNLHIIGFSDTLEDLPSGPCCKNYYHWAAPNDMSGCGFTARSISHFLIKKYILGVDRVLWIENKNPHDFKRNKAVGATLKWRKVTS